MAGHPRPDSQGAGEADSAGVDDSRAAQARAGAEGERRRSGKRAGGDLERHRIPVPRSRPRHARGCPTAGTWTAGPGRPGVPGFGEGLPEEAVAAASAAGFGLSASRRAVRVYRRTEGTVPGAEIDALAGEAQRIATLLDGAGASGQNGGG